MRALAGKRVLRDYYVLIKPGIVRGNTLNAAGGFLLASTGLIDLRLMLATLGGTALVIACGCVFNNYLDRNIDAKMKRTKKRPLVSGTISNIHALLFGTLLGALGFLVLGLYTNALTFVIGMLALFLYVAVYGYFKRLSPVGTLVGTLPGSMPPVAGYVAVTGRLDGGAWLVFAILVTWQMAHFYAIGLFRQNDYREAGLPILPVVKGVNRTKASAVSYIAAFTVSCILLTVFGYTGYVFAAVMSGLGLVWLGLGIAHRAEEGVQWGKKMFIFSLTVILVLAVMLAIGARLP